MPNLHGRNGPALWRSILEVVGTHWQPVVAGGACRDYFFKQEPKDIDVFVPADCSEDFASIIANLDPKLCDGSVLFSDEAQSVASEYFAGEASECFGVWEGEIIGVPVNIVGRKSLQQGVLALIGTFDFGVNQIAYDLNNEWLTSKSYWADRTMGVWTLAHDRTYAQSLERFDRINARQGNIHTLSIPEELLQ